MHFFSLSHQLVFLSVFLNLLLLFMFIRVHIVFRASCDFLAEKKTETKQKPTDFNDTNAIEFKMCMTIFWRLYRYRVAFRVSHTCRTIETKDQGYFRFFFSDDNNFRVVPFQPTLIYDRRSIDNDSQFRCENTKRNSFTRSPVHALRMRSRHKKHVICQWNNLLSNHIIFLCLAIRSNAF